VKAALDPAEYEQLKQQRSRGVQASAGLSVQDDPISQSGPELEPEPAHEPESAPPVTADASEADTTDDQSFLAIEDADDFAADDSDSEDDGEAEDDVFTPVAVLPLAINHDPVAVQPLTACDFPDSLYMLVDKTVELQARPLREFTELGQLPPDEEELQALQLFANPRQAKRHCGRTQRVIKMPDPEVFRRRASYLQVKGITRLVVEGNLYALPGC